MNDHDCPSFPFCLPYILILNRALGKPAKWNHQKAQWRKEKEKKKKLQEKPIPSEQRIKKRCIRERKTIISLTPAKHDGSTSVPKFSARPNEELIFHFPDILKELRVKFWFVHLLVLAGPDRALIFCIQQSRQCSDFPALGRQWVPVGSCTPASPGLREMEGGRVWWG